MFMGATVSKAQEGDKPSIAVVDFDSRAHAMNQQQVIQFISNELIRIGQYEVMDKYDLEYYAKKDTIKLAGCFAKACLQEVGKKLKVKKLITGSIAELGSGLAVTFRILDVERGVFEKMSTREFLLIQGNEFPMLRIVLNEMFGLPNDQDIVNKLTKKSELDNAINNPYELRLQNDGPRMGMVFLTGYGAKVLTNPEVKGGYAGGYGNVATLFQFGYQFEKQYLNEGNFQALFEFVPMITGLDQGRFIPSINFLNGIRNNMNGWEFAFGPNFSLSKYAMGYDDGNGNFVIKATTGKSLDQEAEDMGKTIIELPDSRGSTQVSTGFLFALGKTFRSGKLNLPVNLFFIPSTTGLRYGISVGWNGKAREVLRD
jgi:TolB-like protein